MSEELQIKAKPFALNNRPQKVSAKEELDTISWRDVVSGSVVLERRSEQLTTVQDHPNIVSPLYETYFYSVDTQDNNYIKVIVDKDFVLWRLANFVGHYANSKKEATALLTDSYEIAETLKKDKIKAKLESLKAEFGEDYVKEMLGQ